MRIFFFVILLFFTRIPVIRGQELNATVTVNASKVQSTNREIFTSMEQALRTFINERKWTNSEFRVNERIQCTFTLIINEMSSDHSFTGELQVQSRRPVFNATYTTTMLNYRDTQLDFEYMQYQPLEFDVNNIRGNLEATIAFYVYLILGLDFDSMSPLGGTPYFRQMQLIANYVQPNGWKGWESFGTQRNRFALTTAFNDASQESFRDMWYNYHRLGLDEMADNATQAREKLKESVTVVSSLYAQRSTSVLITLFGDAKLDELANVYSQATEQEKQKAYDALRAVYPTQTVALDKIKQTNR